MCERYSDEDKKNMWINDNAEYFLDAVKGILKDDLFHIDIASDLAFAYINKTEDESLCLYETLGLRYEHAICLAYYLTDSYKREMNEEWEKFNTEDF